MSPPINTTNKKRKDKYWFRISLGESVLEGRKQPNGSLHLSLQEGEFLEADCLLPPDMVENLMIWLSKAYKTRAEGTVADVIQLPTELPKEKSDK